MSLYETVIKGPGARSQMKEWTTVDTVDGEEVYWWLMVAAFLVLCVHNARSLEALMMAKFAARKALPRV